MPLTGLDAARNAIEIQGPPGDFKTLASGSTVAVGDRFFSEGNINLLTGSTLNYSFSGNEEHNVTLANGPMGIGSREPADAAPSARPSAARAPTSSSARLHPVQMTERVVVKDTFAEPAKKKKKKKKRQEEGLEAREVAGHYPGPPMTARGDSEPAIAISGAVKRFGEITAVDGLDLDVPQGICLGLLGPNGAGKSTTMRMLTGQVIANEGEIRGARPRAARRVEDRPLEDGRRPPARQPRRRRHRRGQPRRLLPALPGPGRPGRGRALPAISPG